MGKRLGIIAAAGEIPNLVQKSASEKGLSCVIAAIKGHAERSSLAGMDYVKWFDVGNIQDVITYFKKNDVSSVLFAGKIDPRIIDQKTAMNVAASRILRSDPNRTPPSLIGRVIAFFEEQGLAVEDPIPYLLSFFCKKGVLTQTQPTKESELDIAFGWGLARKTADLDIGQTVVVKNRAIVAIEGMEGTNEAIERGGRLAGEGTTVVKVGRTNQDPRIDLPAVGLTTLQSLVAAKSAALCFDSRQMPFVQKQEALSLADAHGIAVVAR